MSQTGAESFSTKTIKESLSSFGESIKDFLDNLLDNDPKNRQTNSLSQICDSSIDTKIKEKNIVHKVKLMDKYYHIDSKNIKYLTNIPATKKRSIYIPEVNSHEMDKIIKALNYFVMENTFENFDSGVMGIIDINLIKAVKFLGFVELAEKILDTMKKIIIHSTIITVYEHKDSPILKNINIFIDDVKPHENLPNILDCVILMKYHNKLLNDKLIIEYELNDFLPISSDTIKLVEQKIKFMNTILFECGPVFRNYYIHNDGHQVHHCFFPRDTYINWDQIPDSMRHVVDKYEKISRELMTSKIDVPLNLVSEDEIIYGLHFQENINCYFVN